MADGDQRYIRIDTGELGGRPAQGLRSLSARRGTTYLAEAVYAENRIVVRYDQDELVLLAAYDKSGAELSYASLQETADRLGWRTAVRHGYRSLSQLMAEANDLTRDAEGFVVRFDDGQRLKIKGAEYRRIHALVSRITPLAMWEIMQAGDDLAKIAGTSPRSSGQISMPSARSSSAGSMRSWNRPSAQRHLSPTSATRKSVCDSTSFLPTCGG